MTTGDQVDEASCVFDAFVRQELASGAQARQFTPAGESHLDLCNAFPAHSPDDRVTEEVGLGFHEESLHPRQTRPQKQYALALLLTALFKVAPYVQTWKRFCHTLLSVISIRLGLNKIAQLARRVLVDRTLTPLRHAISTRAVAATAGIASLYWLSKQKDRNRRRPRAKRVAIVGSGIGGCGAAWSLYKAGIDVVVYEKKPKVGGNAKAMTWNVDGKKVETGLAVFAYPEQLFHNYNAMIEELGIETENHDTRFFVTERDASGETECVFAHGKKGWQPEKWLRDDLVKWDSMVSFVRRMNALLQPSATPSLYRMGFFNFLNMLPLRKLCKLWGISDRFWTSVFVPIHTSTFLEVEMDTVPASMAELLDEIIPFSRTPNLRTWKTHAYDVVLKLLDKIPSQNIRTSCAVESARFVKRKNASFRRGFQDIIVLDEDGNEERFDAIVFACSAQAMNRILHGKGTGGPGEVVVPNKSNGLNNQFGLRPRFFNWLETTLLSMVLYTTDRDKTFERGVVHTNGEAVLPAKYCKEVLDAYCNYIEVDKTNPRNLENTFVISSWSPTAQHPDVKGKLPMLVTYNAEEKLKNVDSEWVSTSREAHPCLTFWQLFSSVMLWPILQGARDDQAYFCGSAVLPANGHDLSFLSGLVVANELGAAYPFPNDSKAHADFLRLRTMMLSIWA